MPVREEETMALANPVQMTAPLTDLLDGVSIEVMPRTLGKVADMTALMAPGTRVYIAHIEGTPFEDMLGAARRLAAEGFEVMPHFPARIIADAAMLEDWIKAYAGEAGVREALVLAGGLATPVGAFDSAMQLLETGLFEKHGYRRLHVAGHPEGNRDIDPKGGTEAVDAAVRWKQEYARATGTEIALVTQFAFDAAPVIGWAERLAADGITLPIHVGIAGPAKLQTLIKFAIACGVGPSLGVLQKRAKDLSKLLRPMEPTEVATALAAHRAAHPESLIDRLHIFPLGGIATAAEWVAAKRG